MEPQTIPRVYIAATRQNDGKTTACIGLMGLLRSRFERLGFIKPVGRRYLEVAGHRIDADTCLMHDIYGGPDLLSDMSPIAGLVLTGGVRLRRSVMAVIRRTKIPVVLSKDDTYCNVDRLLENVS